MEAIQSSFDFDTTQLSFDFEPHGSAWIQTFSNIKFNLADPREDQICIEDIAHALSLLARFTGHSRSLYTVGQHSLLGSFLVPPKDALWFLLHDASEAYLGDVSSPLKHSTAMEAAYMPMEAKVMLAICKRFGLQEKQPISVHEIDAQMLWAEKEQLMKSCSWGFSGTAAPIVITEMTPREVEAKFLDRFYGLYK